VRSKLIYLTMVNPRKMSVSFSKNNPNYGKNAPEKSPKLVIRGRSMGNPHISVA